MNATWWTISLVLLIIGFVVSGVATFLGTKNAVLVSEADGIITLTRPETLPERVRAGALPAVGLALATAGGFAGLMASPPM